jgi:3-hydroxybutyrate dehydrogenase
VIYSDADISKPDEIAGMVERMRAEFGGVDILVNNAGIQHVAPIEEFPVEKWDAIIGINLSGAFHTSRLAIPDMKKNGWGRIINVASAHALVASPFKSAYVAAKHGLAGLTKTIALEVAEHGVTANAICPGYVLTPLVRKQIPETAKARGISEDAVMRDVLLAARRPGSSSRCRKSPRSRRFCAPIVRPRSPAVSCRSMAAGPRTSAADLKFLHHLQQARSGTSNR